jgi:hypothetical protein
LAIRYSTLDPVWLRELSAAAPVATAAFVILVKPYRVVVSMWTISIIVLAVRSVTDNRPTGILNRANTLGEIRYNWRVLLSGHVAEYAYSWGCSTTIDRSRSYGGTV